MYFVFISVGADQTLIDPIRNSTNQLEMNTVNPCGVKIVEPRSDRHTSILKACTIGDLLNYPTNWPREINCEMNVQEWEASLRKAGILQEYKDVIDGF